MYIAPSGDIQFFKNIPLDPAYRHVVKFNDAAQRDAYFDRWFLYHPDQRIQITKVQYTRIRNGIIKASGQCHIFEEYNYIRFRNNTGTGKTIWYYAFLTEVNFLSNDVTEIHFSLDIFTSFLPFITLKPSFIERSHTVTDNYGEHILPEPDISVSDYVYEKVTRINDRMEIINPETLSGNYATPDGRPRYKNTLLTAQPVDFQSWVFIVVSTYAFSGGYSGIVIKNNPEQIYNPLYTRGLAEWEKNSITELYNGTYFTVLYNGDEINEFLKNSVSVLQGDESAGILGIFMFPADFILNTQFNVPDTSRVPFTDPCRLIRIQTNTNWGNSNNYTIQNNKLYSYPYTYFTVTTHDGQKIDVRQENFSKYYNPSTGMYETSHYMWFTIFSLISASPQSILYPGKNWWSLYKNIYKGSSAIASEIYEGETYNGVDTETSDKLSISSYPMCSYKTDAYMAWLAQNQGKLNIESTRDTVSLINSFAGDLMGLAGSSFSIGMSDKPSINPVAGIGGSILSTVQRGEDFYFKRWTREDNIRLAQNLPPVPHGSDSASADILSKSFGFRMWCVHLKPESAEIVDNFFTMFGYNRQITEIPNLTARYGFTYIRTKGVNLFGEIPQEYLTLMRQSFDNGLTFWKCNSENMLETNIRNENTPLSWILDYTLNSRAGLSEDEYQPFTLSLTKQQIESGFQQEQINGIAFYTSSFTVPVPVSADTISVSAGQYGEIQNASIYLNLNSNPDYLTDKNRNPLIFSVNPVSEIAYTTDSVTVKTTLPVVRSLVSPTSELAFTWLSAN